MAHDTAARKRSARGGRAARQSASRTEIARPAFIQRKIPYYDFLDEEALVRLEDHADWLIQEIGIEFRDDPEAIRIWKSAGADVDGVRVRLPPGAARELCKTAPSQITQHARNPANTVKIGDGATVFAPVYGPPFVRCLDKGRRYGALED
ncbi:MAG: trimethylamine methyltransferase family protein, partial [Hyphomicrobiaceae bacterium]